MSATRISARGLTSSPPRGVAGESDRAEEREKELLVGATWTAAKECRAPQGALPVREPGGDPVPAFRRRIAAVSPRRGQQYALAVDHVATFGEGARGYGVRRAERALAPMAAHYLEHTATGIAPARAAVQVPEPAGIRHE